MTSRFPYSSSHSSVAIFKEHKRIEVIFFILITYSRDCAQYNDFLDRAILLELGYDAPRLKSSLPTILLPDLTIETRPVYYMKRELLTL